MILVINLGLKSVRAIVFDENGTKLRSAARPVTTFLNGDSVEQDPAEWWAKTIEVVCEATVDREIRLSIKHVTVTSSACCLVLADASGNPLRNAIMVSDKRAACESEALGGSDAMRQARSENPNISAHPSMMLPKLMWLAANEPEHHSTARWYLSSNDYLIGRMTGRFVTDPLNAEKFCYLPSSERWHEGVLAEAGVDQDKLPDVVPVGTDIGSLTPETVADLGLGARASCRLTITAYDAICSIFGSGASEEGDACDVSGTVSSLRLLSSSAPAENPGNIFVQHDSFTGIYMIGGSTNLGGGLIEWAKQCFYTGESLPYEQMEREARESRLGADGLIFLPYLMGERAPLWDQHSRGIFFGIERGHSRKQFIRSVFESTAFSLLLLKEVIEAVAGNFRTVSVSGGLARIELISQIKADVLDTEIRVPGEFETTALGAFILCTLAAGWRSSLAEAGDMIPIREVVMPIQRNVERYREIAGMYKELYACNKALFEKRREFMSRVYDGGTVSIENL